MQILARKKYFVYTLALDNKGRHVFYVGKGSGQRPHDHANEAFRDVYSLKCAVIRYLFDHKLTYWIHIAEETDDEDEAFWLEKKTITAYPYRSLVNVVHGSYKAPKLIPRVSPLFDALLGTLTNASTGEIVSEIIERHPEHIEPRLIYAYDRLVVPPYFRHIRYQFLEYGQP